MYAPEDFCWVLPSVIALVPSQLTDTRQPKYLQKLFREVSTVIAISWKPIQGDKAQTLPATHPQGCNGSWGADGRGSLAWEVGWVAVSYLWVVDHRHESWAWTHTVPWPERDQEEPKQSYRRRSWVEWCQSRIEQAWPLIDLKREDEQ